MKLIDKDALVAEIDKRLYQLTDAAFDSMIGRNLIEIRDSLYTLETKEVDLDKEIDDIFQKYKNGYNGLLICKKSDFSFIAKYFFELGLKAAQKGE